jgi:hypothetical protein
LQFTFLDKWLVLILNVLEEGVRREGVYTPRVQGLVEFVWMGRDEMSGM